MFPPSTFEWISTAHSLFPLHLLPPLPIGDINHQQSTVVLFFVSFSALLSTLKDFQVPMDRLEEEVAGMKMNLYAIKKYLDEAFIGIVSHINNIEKIIQLIKEKKKFANDANITDQGASDASPVTPGLMKEAMKGKEKVEYLGDVEIPFYTHCYFNYMDKVPVVMRPFTLDTEEPMGDGTGGFMALALALGYRKENWIKVQVDLLVELSCFKQEYVKMFSVHGFKNCVENL
ncbi:hypothetical protein IFM89_019747 [Coptis chinensis]|uniref:Uncharacterized protein n=1 Tax=Coptis chinensis TaxID=261450 RepID=A0A835LFQ5_9MAGN|nr:hypothetical protein IFM89_019747 [Coptis chinensis]